MAFDPISLRRCGFDDVEALALVGAATFLDGFAGVLDGAAIVAHCARNHTAAAYTQALSTAGCRVWIAEASVGHAPVGYVMLTRPDLPMADLGDGDVELKRIYLLSRFHGQGQRLMDRAIEGAREFGGRRLLLGVYAGNARALAFYRRNGFVPVGVRQFRVGEMLCDDLVLARAI